jgi:hypothetical protein
MKRTCHTILRILLAAVLAGLPCWGVGQTVARGQDSREGALERSFKSPPDADTFEVKVTNLWVNRLIGDQQPGVNRKYTYTTMPFYKADSPLLPSGLLGPVRLVRVTAE